MAFTFPEDKKDFTAANGVTYSWNGEKWVTKTFKADESVLEDYVKEDQFTSDQAAQDQLIAENRRSIEELEVTKGPVSRYTCKGTSFNVATRNGDLYVNDATAANVTIISFAAFDLNGNPTRPVSVGDIVEFVESATLKTVGQVSRFRVTSGDDPGALEVVYLNGENNFTVGETEEVYIYPQNEETASKDYVDDNFLPLTGGELTGPLRMKKGSEKTHPQWKITPNGGTDYATNIYGLEGQMRLRTSHTGDEGDHDGSHIVLDPDVAGGGANQTTKIYKVPIPHRNDMAANKGYVDNTAVLKTGNDWQIMEPSLGLLGGEEDTGSNLYLANKGFIRWGYGAFETQGEYGGYAFMRDDTTFEIGTYKDVDLKINATNPEFVHSPSVPDPSQDEHATNRKYVLDQIRANAGTDYTLPTATTSTKGGVTSATNSGTYVPCTKMANTGSNIGVVQSTNTTQGVNYKGQACITNQSTPDASNYQQGALIFSTSTNSLYIRT